MAGEAGCRDGRKESHKELGRGQRQRRLREGNVGENEEAARRRAGGMATAVERGKGRGCGARKSARCGGEWPRRKSAGPGPRSFEALRWLARLDVAGIEPLGLALGFGRRATYSHLARLADAGLVVRAYDPDGSVVAITAAGRRALNGPRAQVRLGATRGRGLQHVRAVSWVAALLTIRARAWVQRARDAPRPVVARPGPVVRQRQRSPPGSRSPRRGRARGGRGGLWRTSRNRLLATLSGYEDAIASTRIAGLISVSDRAGVLDRLKRAAGHLGSLEQRFRTRPPAELQAKARGLRDEASGNVATRRSKLGEAV